MLEKKDIAIGTNLTQYSQEQLLEWLDQNRIEGHNLENELYPVWQTVAGYYQAVQAFGFENVVSAVVGESIEIKGFGKFKS